MLKETQGKKMQKFHVLAYTHGIFLHTRFGFITSYTYTYFHTIERNIRIFIACTPGAVYVFKIVKIT